MQSDRSSLETNFGEQHLLESKRSLLTIHLLVIVHLFLGGQDSGQHIKKLKMYYEYWEDNQLEISDELAPMFYPRTFEEHTEK